MPFESAEVNGRVGMQVGDNDVLGAAGGRPAAAGLALILWGAVNYSLS